MNESRVGHDRERDSQATSKETLEDLEESEKLTDSKRAEKVSSPDGSFDEDTELEKADPM